MRLTIILLSPIYRDLNECIKYDVNLIDIVVYMYLVLLIHVFVHLRNYGSIVLSRSGNKKYLSTNRFVNWAGKSRFFMFSYNLEFPIYSFGYQTITLSTLGFPILRDFAL